ncbi:MAG: CMP/dCMP kinase [Frankiales bacterium]|nr:CMP/dCMP kinase [Frankiales bacterium]
MTDTRTAHLADRPAQPAERELVIAVDGPSGAGKSTVSRGAAERLGLRYLDTGSMYRAITRRVLDAGVDVNDPAAVAAVAAAVRLEPGTDPARPTIHADGQDLTHAVRSPEVTDAVSAVSAVPAVRACMVEQQRQIIGAGGIVVEGRDIGTTVAPDADVKVYLVADAGKRAQRRTLELRSTSDHDDQTSAAATEEALSRRDALDSGRAASPLARAADAVQIDTTTMSVDEVIDAILELAKGADGERQQASAEPVGPAEPVQPSGSRARLVRSRWRAHPRLIRAMSRFGWWLFHRVFRVRVFGAEHVPSTGPVLLAGNHTSFLDGPVVFGMSPRAAVFFIKSELYGGPLDRALDWLGQIPINRGRPDRPALKRGLALLADGQAVGMFPEGSRGSGDLSNVQHGIAYLALKADCPVVPVACFGTVDALPMGRRLPKWKTRVDVVFGPTFTVRADGDPSARRTSAEAAEQIRQHLREHLTAAAELTGRPAPQPPDAAP